MDGGGNGGVTDSLSSSGVTGVSSTAISAWCSCARGETADAFVLEYRGFIAHRTVFLFALGRPC